MPSPRPALPAVPILETSRLLLREYRAEDFEACVAMWQDPDYYRYLSPAPLPNEEIWKMLLRNAGHWALRGYGPWAVEEKASGRFIGTIGFFDFKRDLAPSIIGTPEIGWVLAPGAHGQGFASEGVAAALAWAEAHFDHARTVCLIHPENQPSLRVAAKFGYREFARTTYKGEPGLLLERPGQPPTAS